MTPEGEAPGSRADVEGFRSDLSGIRRLHLDPSVLARHLRGERPHAELTRVLFQALEDGGPPAQTSTFSVFQLMVEPYRQGADELVRQAASYLSASSVELVPVTEEVARRAAEVRARLGSGPGRSMQIASALLGGADCYLTDSSSLRRIADVRVLEMRGYMEKDVR